MPGLHGPVDLGGNNRESDVLMVQNALKDHGVSPDTIDRICGRRTIAAIEHFQACFLAKTDGPITNPRLLAMIATENVGPFRATGLKPALASLRTIFAEVRRELPDLYPLFETAGMKVNRLQRGSTTKVSNHAWGSAIDLKIAGKLVPFGAPNSIRGIDALVPYFNRAGWYWGGGYRRARADAVHFECGSEMLRMGR